MRRLYQKIYLTIIASLVLVVLVAGGVWRFGAEFSPAKQAFEIVGRSWRARCCRRRTRRSRCRQQAIKRIAEQLGTDIALFDNGRAS